MTPQLTILELQKIYNLLKKKANDEYDNNQYISSWHFIHEAESVIQEFNWEYADDDLEQLLHKLAVRWLPDTPNNYSAQENKVVVIDDWCVSYILVLQYIEALVSAGVEILYITSRDIQNSPFPNIISRISTYPRLKYVVIPNNSIPVDKWCVTVHQHIINFRPSKIIAHIGPCSQFLPVIARLPKTITTYRSNLDDQCFWIGRSIINFTLEFRPFGVAVSRDRRKLRPEQQLYVPFYPIKDGNTFGGFPKLPKNSVVLFSGGDFYKTLDPNYTFWNLVKKVLLDNPNAILLYATKHGLRTQEEFLKSFVKKNHLENQFYDIGFRPDINEVFAHVDIFLGTCPVCGSLTSQLAAINHKPILQYYLPGTDDDETEQALNYNNPNLQISYTDKDAFFAEASRLINDVNYRKQQGELAYNAMIKPEQFDKIFIDAITSNYAPCPTKQVNYTEVAHRWLWPEQMGYDNHLGYLVPMLKNHGLLKDVPELWIKYNYYRFFSKKLWNPAWYKNKVKEMLIKMGFFRSKAWIKKQIFYSKLKREDAIKKKKVACLIEQLPFNMLCRKNDESDIIVSLTSFGKRVKETVPYALYSIFTQSKLPNRIVLWLDHENWCDDNLPPLVKRLQKSGLEVRYCEDIKSYKKLIPTLRAFPHNPIIVIDDDVYYDKDLVWWLVDAYEHSDKRTVYATCAKIPEKRGGKYIPYSEWKGDEYADEQTNVSLIGCGGGIYPPDIFDDEILKSDIFMSLAPTADDLWFWVQERRMSVSVKLTPKHGYHLLRPVDRIEDYDINNADNLTRINVIQGNNALQFDNLLNYYHID